MSILLPCLLAACTAALAPLPKNPAPLTRVMRPVQDPLRPGDQLVIRVWRAGGAIVTVDAQRKIRHPLFGELGANTEVLELAAGELRIALHFVNLL